MEGKRNRLSLSRKRKKGIADELSCLSESIHIPLKSELTCLSVEDGKEPQDTGDLEDRSCGKNHDSRSAIRLSPKEEYSNKTKRSIAMWLRKSCKPKTVPCPVCGKVVFLSTINEHLDNICESGAKSKPCDDPERVDELTSSDFKKDYRGLEKATVTTGNVRDMKSRECKVGGRITQANDNLENLVPLKTYSELSSREVSRRAELCNRGVNDNDDSSACKGIFEGPLPGSCNGITKGDSPDLSNGITKGDSSCSWVTKGDSSCQGLPVQIKSEEFVDDPKEWGIEGKDLQTNPEIDGTKNLSNNSTNCNENIESPNERLEEENSQIQAGEVQNYEPYYLANFKLVLKNVLSNEDDRRLFNEQDNKIIGLFNEMSPEEQKLYIRLFQRKLGWFRCCKLDYPKISKDLKPVMVSLIEKGFLQDEHHLTNLQEALSLIAAPELKLLVKSLHICGGKKGGTKEEIIETIVNLAENQKTLFGSLKSVVLKRARQAVGSCVRVAAFPREVFNRVLLLFTMNVIPDDEDTANNGQAQQLSTLFLANIGKVVYPPYLIDRPTPVFYSRERLVAFAHAYQQKHEMFMALESNHFEHAYSYYPEASKKFNSILDKLENDSELAVAHLPEHLRCFSAEWAITKMCYFGVEVLQKWRQYEEAVKQLELLLRQDVYCFDSRGRWYDRLALNLHQHLKRPEKAMEVIRQGLSDPHVRFGRRLALVQRAKRILSSPAFQKGRRKKCEEFADLELKEPSPCKCITISGTRCAQLGVFIAPEVNQDGAVNHGTKTFYAVEEYALSYYRRQGFDQGIHGEGSTFSSLYCLFLWDIIFTCGIPDVFRSPFQAAPLDMCFDSFYTNRKEIIDKRLEEITEASFEKLQQMLSTSWSKNEGQVCAGLSWDRFIDVEQAKQLVACLGGAVLSGIFARFAQGYRYYRSGLPDLVVWNSSTHDYRIAEVKGPGDKLSTKQQIWLEVLESLGANVEVCYVTDIGAKRLRVSK